jgi:Domain of unknown function (DUF4381)
VRGMAVEKPDFIGQNFGNDWLTNLNEVSLPQVTSSLPSGPLWWALAAMGIWFLGHALWQRYLHWCGQLYRRQALTQLSDLQTLWQQPTSRVQASRELVTLLKRVALTAWPRVDVASMVGSAWLDFLTRTTKASKAPPTILGELAYLPESQLQKVTTEQWQESIAWAQAWIREHKTVLVDNSIEAADVLS